MNLSHGELGSPSCVVPVTEATDFGRKKILSVSAANAAGCA